MVFCIGFCINFYWMRKTENIKSFWALQMGNPTWLPRSLSAEEITARSMLSLGSYARFETRLRLCLMSKILNVFWKFCRILAILSFLCLWVDSVPQTDLLRYPHLFITRDFWVADLPRLAHSLLKWDIRQEGRSVVWIMSVQTVERSYICLSP